MASTPAAAAAGPAPAASTVAPRGPEQAPPASAVRLPADAAQRIAHWADSRAQALALLHKQQGRWGALRWRDVPLTLDGWRLGLVRLGVGPGARLAVSGALEPGLILLALAAQAAGATVAVIDRHAQGPALGALLRAAAPTHAFVQDRKAVSAWLASGHANGHPVPLIAVQPVAHDDASWRIVPLAALRGGDGDGDDGGGPVAAARGPRAAGLRRRLRGQELLWVDEGTEWAGGLEQVLAAWLAGGAALAAPEVSASAARDRHELQPGRLLASPARLRQVQDELRARLAPPGHWQRRLVERAAARPGRAWAQWLLRRVARLHGVPAAFVRQEALDGGWRGEGRDGGAGPGASRVRADAAEAAA